MSTLADLYLARLRALGFQHHTAVGVAWALKYNQNGWFGEWMRRQPALVRLVGAWVR